MKLILLIVGDISIILSLISRFVFKIKSDLYNFINPMELCNLINSQFYGTKELAKTIRIAEANLSILRSGKAKGVRFGTINKSCFYIQCNIGDILIFVYN